MTFRIALAFTFLALAPVAASAESQQDAQACMGDAFNICGHAIPDRNKVAACLAHNIRRLSPPCQTVMRRHAKPGAARARFSARD